MVLSTADDEMTVQLKSDMDSEIQRLWYTARLESHLQQVIDGIMEHKVVKTDMKLRHIYAKLWEV